MSCGTSYITWCCHYRERLSTLLALCEGNPLVTGGFPSQRTSDVQLKCFLQAVEQTVQFPVIWDDMISSEACVCRYRMASAICCAWYPATVYTLLGTFFLCLRVLAQDCISWWIIEYYPTGKCTIHEVFKFQLNYEGNLTAFRYFSLSRSYFWYFNYLVKTMIAPLYYMY